VWLFYRIVQKWCESKNRSLFMIAGAYQEIFQIWVLTRGGLGFLIHFKFSGRVQRGIQTPLDTSMALFVWLFLESLKESWNHSNFNLERCVVMCHPIIPSSLPSYASNQFILHLFFRFLLYKCPIVNNPHENWHIFLKIFQELK